MEGVHLGDQPLIAQLVSHLSAGPGGLGAPPLLPLLGVCRPAPALAPAGALWPRGLGAAQIKG